MKTLTKPLTLDEIKNQVDDNRVITGHVLVDVSDLIDNDLEAVLDLLSEKLIDSLLGMDINYEPVGVQDGQIIMWVSLDASMLLDDEES